MPGPSVTTDEGKEPLAAGRPLVIVRRGMAERFATLRRDLASEDVEVRWDRRVGERRRRLDAMPAGTERRRQDRRRPPPPSWVLLDFVVAWFAR